MVCKSLSVPARSLRNTNDIMPIQSDLFLHHMAVSMFFFFSFLIHLESSVKWLEFKTEKMLSSACTICEIEVSKLNKNSTLFSNPEKKSKCSNNEKNDTVFNSYNPYCSLILSLRQDFENNNNSLPKDYCSTKGPCKYTVPKTLNGPYCANCLNVISYSLYADRDSRLRTIQDFCASSYTSSIQFCDAFQYILEASLKTYFLNSSNATLFCISSGFCYEKDLTKGDSPDSDNSNEYYNDYYNYYYYSDDLYNDPKENVRPKPNQQLKDEKGRKKSAPSNHKNAVKANLKKKQNNNRNSKLSSQTTKNSKGRKQNTQKHHEL
ncbi:hypothetical protein TRFO_12883 [Tritrichomonas foetus]|uniref:Uncharacterized protein n=1 Tax=Tritrichomonas foetus TaxID=1144522 RepID=A0A1J4L072_9EUKA|nr:hypothetical protein TRFO_12883 [Tritrichomonas foetus]|eukprot:OHT16810.1 hypothetical protein TRFO_12883 [Tritrichomonas foetus]